MTFQENLNKIVDAEQPFTLSTLYVLSNLEPEAQAEFEAVWPTTALERRRRIAGSLQELAEEDIELEFSSIFHFLLKDIDPQVRIEAIEGLWEDETRQFLGRLLDIVEHDPANDVREKAAITLGHFCYLAELGKLPERWVKRLHDTLLELVEHKKLPIEVERRLVEDLGYFANDPRVTKIISEAYNDDDDQLQASALRAMGRNMDTRWIPEVGKEMSNDEPALRYEAATAAGEMSSAELLPSVLKLANDEDMEVRLAAIWAIGQIGGPEASRVLKELTSDKREAVREAAQEALTEVTFNANPLNVLRTS